MADDESLEMRRSLLEQLYKSFQGAPQAQLSWSADRADPQLSLRVREAQYLLDNGYVSGGTGGDGTVYLGLTSKGRDFVESGGHWNPPAAAQVREAVVRRLGLESLHPAILEASSDLFTDRHYPAAIFEAFKAIEIRVRQMSGLRLSGKDLMAQAFRGNNGKAPPIDVKVEAGDSGENEQEGFRFLFMGAVVGIRNPKAHEVVKQDNPQRALEYLAFASVLMHRLDDAKGPRMRKTTGQRISLRGRMT